jgi:hypothetical protein
VPRLRLPSQERIESSDLGRTLISALIIVVLICLATANLPPSGVQRKLLRASEPYLNVSGLDQNWSVFAPNPPRPFPELRARIRYSDGRIGNWRRPTGDPLLGAHWDVYWFKWEENLLRDPNRDLWRPAAAWIVRSERRAGRDPVVVTLIRRWRDLSPPGSSPSHGPWREYAFYTYRPDGGSTRPGSGA